MSDIYINASDKKLSHSKKTSPAFQVFMKVLWAWEASLTFGKKISVAQDEHIGKGERVGKANLAKLPSAFPHGPGHKHKPSIQSAVEAVTFPSCHETSRCLLSFNRTEFLGPLQMHEPSTETLLVRTPVQTATQLPTASFQSRGVPSETASSSWDGRALLRKGNSVAAKAFSPLECQLGRGDLSWFSVFSPHCCTVST